MAGSKKCTECSGRFSASFFSTGSLKCRLCVLRERMEKRLKEQDEQLIHSNNKIAELAQTVDALKATLGNHEARPDVPSPDAAPPHLAPVENSEVPPQTDSEFIPVRRGAKPTRRVIQPTKCSNRFKILEEEDEPECSYLIGDSMIRQQVTEFCGRVKQKRRVFCLPGAGVDDVIDVIDQVTEDATDKSLLVIHAGTNDVRKTRSEDLLNKYRRLIQ